MTWKNLKGDRNQPGMTVGLARNQLPSVEWLQTLWFAGGSAGVALHVRSTRQEPQDLSWRWIDEDDEQIIVEHTIM